MSEADLYGPICLAASRCGHRLFRNHVGLATHAEGATIRHGLAPGSSDLIGWTRTGLFAAIEVKPPGWRPTPAFSRSPRGRRQAAFIAAVIASGGRAGFATSIDEALRILDGK